MHDLAINKELLLKIKEGSIMKQSLVSFHKFQIKNDQ